MLIIGLHKDKKRQLERAVFPVNNSGRALSCKRISDRGAVRAILGSVGEAGETARSQGRPSPLAGRYVASARTFVATALACAIMGPV